MERMMPITFIGFKRQCTGKMKTGSCIITRRVCKQKNCPKKERYKKEKETYQQKKEMRKNGRKKI